MPLEPTRSHTRLSIPHSLALCSQHPYSIPQIKISSSSLTLIFQIKLSEQLPPAQRAQLRGKVTRVSCRAGRSKYFRPWLQCGSSWLSCSSWQSPEFGYHQEAPGAKAESSKFTWVHSMGAASARPRQLKEKIWKLKAILGGSSEQREALVPERLEKLEAPSRYDSTQPIQCSRQAGAAYGDKSHHFRDPLRWKEFHALPRGVHYITVRVKRHSWPQGAPMKSRGYREHPSLSNRE